MEDLKNKLATQEVELKFRNKDTEALITKIGHQTEKVSHEKSVADAEEQKVCDEHFFIAILTLNSDDCMCFFSDAYRHNMQF